MTEATREEAVDKLRRALVEMRVVGLKTCAPLLLALLRDERFLAGDVDTTYLERFVEDPVCGH